MAYVKWSEKRENDPDYLRQAFIEVALLLLEAEHTIRALDEEVDTVGGKSRNLEITTVRII